jgi:hypothetical protein
MTFTSYAQNFEDVMLWRALKHVKNGFYIEQGAEQPEWASAFKAFCDMGWAGINIAAPLRKLSAAIRPRVNCNAQRNHSGGDILPARTSKSGKPTCRR